MWIRSPFHGGCSYHEEETNSVVTGHYTANPLEFESECKSWTLNGSGDYSSAAEAMAAEAMAADE